MGQISLFLGVAVYMYTEPGSPHKLPHVHVVVGGEKASLSVPDAEVLAASENFPPKKLRAIQTWIDMRSEDLCTLRRSSPAASSSASRLRARS